MKGSGDTEPRLSQIELELKTLRPEKQAAFIATFIKTALKRTGGYIDGAHRNLCDKCCEKRKNSGLLECESCGVRSKEVSESELGRLRLESEYHLLSRH